MTIETKLSHQSQHRTVFCPYRNDGVWCDDLSVCSKCGWHPEVEAQRKKKIKEEMSPVIVTERPRFLLGSGSFSSIEKVDV